MNKDRDGYSSMMQEIRNRSMRRNTGFHALNRRQPWYKRHDGDIIGIGIFIILLSIGFIIGFILK